jgi:hypothetical protein
MMDTKELEPINNEQGDIPWGIIVSQEQVPSLVIEDAGLQFLQIKLLNGLRYVQLTDTETREISFDQDLPDIIKDKCNNCQLRAGYQLFGYWSSAPTEDSKGQCLSFVKRDISDGNGSHALKYTIDPHQRFFKGTYTHFDGTLQTSISMEQTGTTDISETQPSVNQPLNNRVNFQMGIINTNQDQVNFIFDQSGTLESITLAGKVLLGNDSARAELLAIEPETQRGIVTLEGDQLQNPLTKRIVREFLGVDYSSQLVLDTKSTMTSLIDNIDSESPQEPKDRLLFIGAIRHTTTMQS